MSPLAAQNNPVRSLNSLSAVVDVTPPEKLVGKRNQVLPVDIRVSVRSGFHVNSNTPSDEYLIPLKYTWTEGIVKVQDVTFPKPQMQKFAFSDTPMSVLEGEFKTQVKFKVAANAAPGLAHVTGKLRYQACNDRMCLPPRSVDIKIPLEIFP